MQPDTRLITIHDNEKLIAEFISDMVIAPRRSAHKWAEVTNQTPNLKTGYPSQHLASLITGMKGTATGARGNDIIDICLILIFIMSFFALALNFLVSFSFGD